MIPVSGLQMKRAGDIPGGHLVAYRPEQEFVIGLAASAPGHRGVLLLQWERPEFDATNHHCLDLGKAVFQWDGLPGSLVDGALGARPAFGSLAVRPVAAPGAAPVVILGRASGQNLSWDIESGGLVTNLDITAAVLIIQWTVGLNDAQGRFHGLLEFPLRAAVAAS